METLKQPFDIKTYDGTQAIITRDGRKLITLIPIKWSAALLEQFVGIVQEEDGSHSIHRYNPAGITVDGNQEDDLFFRLVKRYCYILLNRSVTGKLIVFGEMTFPTLEAAQHAVKDLDPSGKTNILIARTFYQELLKE